MSRFASIFLSLCASITAPGLSQPNILFISVDDLRPSLGCYGATEVKSPNIDRFAASGVIFDRCYVQVAVCNPSRASMMTGLRPNTLKCWTLRYHFRETRPETVTLPQYLRQHGYHAEGHGKIFHNPWQDPRSWSIPHRFGRGSYTHYTDEQKAFLKEVRRSLPAGSWLKRNVRGPIAHAPEIADQEHTDGEMARTACTRLGVLKQEEEPFFLALGFVLPHLPWCPPKKYWDLYDRDTLPRPDNRNPIKGVPAVELGTNYELSHYADSLDFPAPLEGRVSEEKSRRLLHGYLASVSFIDAQIGLVLDALEQNGLAENTIVILWSDHGYKLGEYGGWGKMTNLEIDTRVPLIIRDPRATANGQRCGAIVETLDLFPTICELAGLPIPSFTEGRSAAKLLGDPGAAHSDAAFSQYIRSSLIGNSIRTNDWRYTEWCDLKTGAIQHRILYDHRDEGSEDENVYDKHRIIADSLQKRLHQTLPNRPVSLRPEIRSTPGGERIKVTTTNRHPGVVRFTWISADGQRRQVTDLPSGDTRQWNTHTGHVFAAESLDGTYDELITIKAGQNEVTLGSAE